jgi:hypothetical protein
VIAAPGITNLSWRRVCRETDVASEAIRVLFTIERTRGSNSRKRAFGQYNKTCRHSNKLLQSYHMSTTAANVRMQLSKKKHYKIQLYCITCYICNSISYRAAFGPSETFTTLHDDQNQNQNQNHQGAVDSEGITKINTQFSIIRTTEQHR